MNFHSQVVFFMGQRPEKKTWNYRPASPGFGIALAPEVCQNVGPFSGPETSLPNFASYSARRDFADGFLVHETAPPFGPHMVLIALPLVYKIQRLCPNNAFTLAQN